MDWIEKIQADTATYLRDAVRLDAKVGQSPVVLSLLLNHHQAGLNAAQLYMMYGKTAQALGVECMDLTVGTNDVTRFAGKALMGCQGFVDYGNAAAMYHLGKLQQMAPYGAGRAQDIDLKNGSIREEQDTTLWHDIRTTLSRYIDRAIAIDDMVGWIVGVGCQVSGALSPSAAQTPSGLCRWALTQVTQAPPSAFTEWLFGSTVRYANNTIRSVERLERDIDQCAVKHTHGTPEYDACIQSAEGAYQERNETNVRANGGVAGDIREGAEAVGEVISRNAGAIVFGAIGLFALYTYSKIPKN